LCCTSTGPASGAHRFTEAKRALIDLALRLGWRGYHGIQGFAQFRPLARNFDEAGIQGLRPETVSCSEFNDYNGAFPKKTAFRSSPRIASARVRITLDKTVCRVGTVTELAGQPKRRFLEDFLKPVANARSDLT
jgi:hypothetical protein